MTRPHDNDATDQKCGISFLETHVSIHSLELAPILGMCPSAMHASGKVALDRARFARVFEQVVRGKLGHLCMRKLLGSLNRGLPPGGLYHDVS